MACMYRDCNRAVAVLPNGALAAILYARQSGRPFLGTCGGFQHALLERRERLEQKRGLLFFFA